MEPCGRPQSLHEPPAATSWEPPAADAGAAALEALMSLSRFSCQLSCWAGTVRVGAEMKMSKPELVRGHNSKYKLWNSSTLLFTPSTACLGAAIGGMRVKRLATN